jgi:hypothetical protein
VALPAQVSVACATVASVTKRTINNYVNSSDIILARKTTNGRITYIYMYKGTFFFHHNNTKK